MNTVKYFSTLRNSRTLLLTNFTKFRMFFRLVKSKWDRRTWTIIHTTQRVAADCQSTALCVASMAVRAGFSRRRRAHLVRKAYWRQPLTAKITLRSRYTYVLSLFYLLLRTRFFSFEFWKVFVNFNFRSRLIRFKSNLLMWL